jgi:hypothetical protein
MQEKKMIKTKHNKKRNTAFLYEVIIREITSSIIEKNSDKKNFLIGVLKEFFGTNKILKKELDLYGAINQTHGMDKEVAEKLLREAKFQYETLDKKNIFNQQTKLINVLSRYSNGKIFSRFVPDYKNLATISQVFNNSVPIKEKILLETTLVNKMVSSQEESEKEKLQTIDSLTYKLFVKKFNEQYSASLLSEQKQLITKYVMSFADSGIEFKLFLNEEIERIKNALKSSAGNKEISGDPVMAKKTNLVLEKVEKYKERQIDVDMIKEVLKIQSLLGEMSNETEGTV